MGLIQSKLAGSHFRRALVRSRERRGRRAAARLAGVLQLVAG